MQRAEVKIPAGFNIGVLIGKGGSNVKEMSARYATRATVDGTRMVVVCSGGQYQAAADAFRRQIATAESSTLGAYPHPQDVVYRLPSGAQLCFKEYYGPAVPQTGANRRPLQLYTLAPTAVRRFNATYSGDYSENEDEDGYDLSSLTSRLALQSLSTNSTGTSALGMQLLRDDAACFARVRRALDRVTSHRPNFSEIKLRYSIGRQTFYESRSPTSPSALRKQYSMPELGQCIIGHDGHFKSMFSEFNDDKAVQLVESRAIAMGLTLEQTKTHVSLHLKDYGRRDGAVAGIVVSLLVADTRFNGCTVRKIKSSTAKPIIAGFVNPAGASGPDFRLKLLAQYHIINGSAEDGAREAWSYAAGCTWSAALQNLRLPYDERFKVDTTRIKAKRVYAGTLSGQAVRFTVSVVEEGDGEHVCLGGCVPAIQSALAQGREVPQAALLALLMLCRGLVGGS